MVTSFENEPEKKRLARTGGEGVTSWKDGRAWRARVRRGAYGERRPNEMAKSEGGDERVGEEFDSSSCIFFSS